MIGSAIQSQVYGAVSWLGMMGSRYTSVVHTPRAQESLAAAVQGVSHGPALHD